jgi:uncharacterized protein YgbK (DUF1537 family)
VLFCIGSTHPATAEQERALAEARPVSAFNDEDAAPEEICEALDRGVHVLLHLRAGRVSPERIRTLTGVRRVPLALSGGDTASAVCGALGAREIRLCGEIAPGIPGGVILGGAADQSPVATKSGGFGAPDALIRIADYFTCPKP